jgi:hypothetical protein
MVATELRIEPRSFPDREPREGSVSGTEAL